jgi:hypothetical protein
VVRLLKTIVAADGASVSEHERSAIAEADAWLRDNRPIRHEAVLADLGLRMADWKELEEQLER